MKSIGISIMFGLMILGANGKEDTLKNLQIIFRHAYRYPLNLKWTENDTCAQTLKSDATKPGNLTNLGKSQMTLLGYFLRIHYNSFIGSDPSKIQVNYSDCYRDKQSAQLVYEALFKNFNDTKVPDVGILNKTIEGEVGTNDTAYITWLESLKWSDRLREQCQSLNKSKNTSCNNRIDFGDISDQLVTEEADGCILPTWLTPEIRDNLLAEYKAIYESIGLCKSKNFVESNSDEMLKWMNAVFDPKNDGKYKNTYLYASHDVNIAIILTRMGVFNSLPVPFGAAVIFEQHSTDNGTVIRIFYDNSTDYSNFQMLKLPGCDLDCPYETFVKIVTGSYPCSFAVRPEALGLVPTVIMSLMLGWLLY